MTLLASANTYGAAQTSAFNRSVAQLRHDIETSRSEAVNGRVADPVAALGARNGERLALEGAAKRIETVVATNNLASSFLSVSQKAVGQVAQLSADLSQTLVAASGGGASRSFLASEADATLESLHSILTMHHAGRPVFGGEETQAAPLVPLDDVRAEFTGIFTGHFGFAPDDPAAAGISGADLERFLDIVAMPALSGTAWSGGLSQAGSPSTARIAAGDRVTLGPTVDAPALQNAFLSALVTAELTGAPLSAQAFETTIAFGLSATASAASEAAQLQGATAITEARVEQASERLLAHSGVLTGESEAMVSKDAFAAAARFNDLTVKLEAAYTMTGRLQQITLLRFLP